METTLSFFVTCIIWKKFSLHITIHTARVPCVYLLQDQEEEKAEEEGGGGGVVNKKIRGLG
jgi:hypothetical protein